MGRSAGRAQAPSGQYSGRCQDVNLIWCWEWRLVAGGVCRPPGLVESIGAAIDHLPWERLPYFLSATLRRADRARGLAATASSEGRPGCRVTTRRAARGAEGPTVCW